MYQTRSIFINIKTLWYAIKSLNRFIETKMLYGYLFCNNFIKFTHIHSKIRDSIYYLHNTIFYPFCLKLLKTKVSTILSQYSIRIFRIRLSWSTQLFEITQSTWVVPIESLRFSLPARCFIVLPSLHNKEIYLAVGSVRVGVGEPSEWFLVHGSQDGWLHGSKARSLARERTIEVLRVKWVTLWKCRNFQLKAFFFIYSFVKD